MSLRSRIFLIISTLVIITIVGALVMVSYTYRMEGLLTRVIDRYMGELQAAESLELAFVNQKGFVSYYFMDGDPNWLLQMEQYRHIFRDKIKKSKRLATTVEEKKALDLIESKYIQYVTSKDKVIDLYKSGERKTGSGLHEKVRGYFFNVLKLCDTYKQLFREKVQKVKEQSLIQARKLRIIVGSVVLTVLFLAIILIFFLVHDILEPVRRLALETTDRKSRTQKTGDEMKALSLGVHDLIKEYDQTQSELEKSREYLLQSEKMALVGKLAAGTSHSIRNPLTSVKMRLFSLSRSLDLDGDQKEDFDVISKEIGHIDNIVQNFLEFSRPPRLELQSVSLSDIVDQTVRLLRHRLESYEVSVTIQRSKKLPKIQADPEQLKEVLVNIVVNACEAMENGGTIVLREEEGFIESLGRVVIISINDNGPGIPEDILKKIFEPFFTTKEEGTGLGLSIATRIIEEHRGWLDVRFEEGQGTTFIITMPIKDSDFEHHFDYRRR
ncbi:MAG: MCP four helix bundle domain-containing protein [Deltaproteobacteria bacterium]|nr:MCP four helix bundle domain-containing protein [Deltaproteobacteria bacterium]MBW2619753.1 MCP four helix bundle domain-containing protein [Deltaproteobacteria bacterium]